jgi:very-short-patch-repair endonuclease
VEWERLWEAAAGQHRLVLTRDLAGFGVTRPIARRLRAEGWLADVRRGVTVVGGGEPSEWQKVVAVSLVAGSDAALSHYTAARVHHLACVGPAGSGGMVGSGAAGRGSGAAGGSGAVAGGAGPAVAGASGATGGRLAGGSGAAGGRLVDVHITVPRPAHPRLPGCVVHRVRDLTEGDVAIHRGVRVTTPIRTLTDLVPGLTPAVLEKTVDEGSIAGLWTPRDLAAVSERRGMGALRRLVDLRLDAPPTDSPLEQRAVQALLSLGPFETRYQVVVDGRVFILDIAWPAYQVAAECDGWAVRSRSRGKFDHDRRRNNLLSSHGWSIVHLTSAMSDDEMRSSVVKMLLKSAAR